MGERLPLLPLLVVGPLEDFLFDITPAELNIAENDASAKKPAPRQRFQHDNRRCPGNEALILQDNMPPLCDILLFSLNPHCLYGNTTLIKCLHM